MFVMRFKSVARSLGSLLRDTGGLVSVEATILLATLAVGASVAGYAAGPVIKRYADALSANVQTARCLAAGEAGQPFPNCP